MQRPETEYKYVVRFDKDGQNMDKWFYEDEYDEAVRYAEDNIDSGPTIYGITEEFTEEVLYLDGTT